MIDAYIHHIVSAGYFHAQDPRSSYRPAGLEAEGFIHCTQGLQLLLEVANRYYRQVPGEFLVLVIDPARVHAEVRYEAPIHPDGAPARPDEPRFPHIYGPLNREAIVEVHPAMRAPDGTFVAV